MKRQTATDILQNCPRSFEQKKTEKLFSKNVGKSSF